MGQHVQNDNRGRWLTILSILLTILGLLFGDNLYERYTGHSIFAPAQKSSPEESQTVVIVVTATARAETVPSPTGAVVQPSAAAPLPTATKQPQPSATAKPPETIHGELSVTCNSKAGTRLDAPIFGRYMISYAGGSYSPESWTGASDLHWRSRINIYRNRVVQFGERAFQQGDISGITYYEPTSPDAVFNGNYTKMTQSQSEDSARAAPAVTIDLNKSDFLTFVCMDDQPYFANNQGAMYFIFVATER